MELIPLLLTISTVYSLPDKNCNRLKVGDNFFERELLWANLGRPYNLNIHKATNILFFSYTVPETYSDTDFQLAFYNIDTKEYQTIAGIKGGCSTAIDNSNDDIYMGGSDGIYKYNTLTLLADFYKEKGKNIWSLFHRRNLFYISYPEQKLHMEVDGKFPIVKEFENFEIDHFYMSNKGEIYFANKTGLYKYDNYNRNIEVIDEMLTVRQIVEDQAENVYVCTNIGIFKDRKFEGLKKIVDLKNVFSLAFDRENNFIISDETNIMRLKPSAEGCEGDSHW